MWRGQNDTPVLSVLTLLHIPAVGCDGALSVSTPSYPSPAWGKVDGEERWTPLQQLVGKRPFLRQNSITREKRCKNNPISVTQTSAELLTSAGGHRAVIGLLSKRAGFSSKQTSSITSFNSVRWKKRAGGRLWEVALGPG